MSRIGVARVEKRQELDGASLYTVHDFYALTGLDKARNELSQVRSLQTNRNHEVLKILHPGRYVETAI